MSIYIALGCPYSYCFCFCCCCCSKHLAIYTATEIIIVSFTLILNYVINLYAESKSVANFLLTHSLSHTHCLSRLRSMCEFLLFSLESTTISLVARTLTRHCVSLHHRNANLYRFQRFCRLISGSRSPFNLWLCAFTHKLFCIEHSIRFVCCRIYTVWQFHRKTIHTCTLTHSHHSLTHSQTRNFIPCLSNSEHFQFSSFPLALLTIAECPFSKRCSSTFLYVCERVWVWVWVLYATWKPPIHTTQILTDENAVTNLLYQEHNANHLTCCSRVYTHFSCCHMSM